MNRSLHTQQEYMCFLAVEYPCKLMLGAYEPFSVLTLEKSTALTFSGNAELLKCVWCGMATFGN